jgi:hypothetical protein
MKKCKNVKTGDVVQFPHHQFAPYRSGWNGWIFKTGIVVRLYISVQGVPCAELVYSYRDEDVKHKHRIDELFQVDLEWAKRQKNEFGIDNEEIRFLTRHDKI